VKEQYRLKLTTRFTMPSAAIVLSPYGAAIMFAALRGRLWKRLMAKIETPTLKIGLANQDFKRTFLTESLR
jgi:hypothetical protein